MKPTRTHAVGAGVAAVALVVGGVIGAAVAPDNTSSTTVTGRLMVAVAMGGVPIEASVRTASGSVPLDITNAAQAQALELANDDVHATGTKNDDGTLTVAKIEPASARQPTAGLSTMASNMKLAVVLLHAPGSTAEPVTTTYAQQAFFGSYPQSVNTWFSEVSGGQEHVTGQVFGWYNAPSSWSGGCPSINAVDYATQAAQTAGVNLSSFTNVVAVTPNVSCPYAGIAWVGSGGVHLNGGISLGVAEHELGHNLGLWHAGLYTCASEVQCTSDYGDGSDTMGSGNGHHYDAIHKQIIGWLPPSSIVTQSSGTQTYTLTPEENPTAGGVQLVYAQGATHRVSVERRAPVGFDSALNGVYVHVADFTGTDDTVVPQTFSSTGLQPGQSYTEPVQHVTTTVNADGTVTVCVGPCGAPPPTTTTVAGSTTTTGSSSTTTTKPTTTTVGPVTTTTRPGVQQPPTLGATVQADGTVKVTWTPPRTIARTALQLLRGPSPSHVGTVGTFYLSALDQGYYIDARVPVGTTAYYKARFTTAGTATAWSAVVSVTR